MFATKPTLVAEVAEAAPADGLSCDILGGWELRVGDREVALPSGQLRTLLASLVLSADEPVSLEVLAERLWPEQPDADKRGAVHTYVARLRKLLGADLIETSAGGGYRLRQSAVSVDLYRFRDLVRRAGDAGSTEREVALLREAARLWRGRPFGNTASPWLDREVVPRLMEEWFAVTERTLDLALAAGQASAIVPELTALTDRYPTRESLWRRLITALHRAGRRGDALEAFQRARVRLAEELGIDPGQELVEAQRAVLRDGPNPVAPIARIPPRVTPHQLPHSIAGFAGRYAELAMLAALLDGRDDAGPAPMIVAIDGAPGTGKTTLAVQWAHRVAYQFPDGQLYLNLCGYGPGEPMSPAFAADTLLRALGVSSELVPAGVEERAALLRTTLAGRRVLMVLDNARDADQVRPLLPGDTGLVIVTSRSQLRGLSIRDGAHRLTLRPLTQQQAVELLAASIGEDRVAAEPEAAVRLARLCDHLPLALAIVAERVNRMQPLADVVTVLEDEAARLDELRTGEDDPHTDLRVALSWSYRALPPDAAALFRLLGLYPASEVALEAAGALAGLTQAQAKVSLDQLVAAHLLEQRRPQRYELHDLIRLYARDLTGRQDSDRARDDALRRLLDWYLHAAVSADSRLLPHRRRDFLPPYRAQTAPPGFADVADALAWFEQEYHSLKSVVGWAAAHGWGGHAWRTVMAMTSFLDARVAWRDGLELLELAFDAARTAGEPLGEAYTLNSLGCIYLDKRDWAAAVEYFWRSLHRFEESGHRRGQAMLSANLGLVYAEMGEPERSIPHSKRALELCGELRYPRGTAFALDNLGVAYLVAGDHAKALECFREAHEINTALHEFVSDAMCLRNMGNAYAAVGQHRNAVHAFRESAALFRRMESLRWEAMVLIDLGKVVHRAGHPVVAGRILRSAVAALQRLADPQADDVKAALDGVEAAVLDGTA